MSLQVLRAGQCPTRTRPGPKAIGQGVGEWQGHSIQKVRRSFCMRLPLRPQLGADTAPPARVVVQGAIQHGRCGIESDSHAAPQPRARPPRDVMSARTPSRENQRLLV